MCGSRHGLVRVYEHEFSVFVFGHQYHALAFDAFHFARREIGHQRHLCTDNGFGRVMQRNARNDDGDRATARSRQLSIIRGKSGDPTPVLAGRYEDEFVRRDGHWKILHRLDITFIPTLEQWTKKMKEGILTPEK